MSIPNAIFSFALQATAPAAAEPTASVDLGIWKWVIIIGASAIIILYSVKRIADIFVKKRTDTLIRQVGDAEEPRQEPLENLEKMNKELDEKTSK